jgi:HTH-type transcriptional regulator, sugar sensing transcriptional regulator
LIPNNQVKEVGAWIMIVQKEFLNKLKDFGLNSYEGKLWTALLSRGIATAGELSDIANVPRSRSYDVLESLEKKGFIIMKLGKPIKYIAVPPADVIERVKRKLIEDAESQTRMIEELRKSHVLEELNQLHSEGITTVEPTEVSGVVKGRNNLFHHMESMIKGAEQRVTFLTTEKGFARKAEQLKNVLRKATERGIKVKFAAPIAKGAKALEIVSPFSEIRHSGNIIGRWCIIDGKEILFMLLNDDNIHSSYDLGVWIKTPFFVSAMEKTFERAWDDMKVIK